MSYRRLSCSPLRRLLAGTRTLLRAKSPPLSAKSLLGRSAWLAS